MLDRKGFSETIREGEQLTLPLPPAPGIRPNRITECRLCGLVHAGAYDDIVCRYEADRLHPT